MTINAITERNAYVPRADIIRDFRFTLEENYSKIISEHESEGFHFLTVFHKDGSIYGWRLVQEVKP